MNDRQQDQQFVERQRTENVERTNHPLREFVPSTPDTPVDPEWGGSKL